MQAIWNNWNFRIAIIVALMAALWLLSGVFASDDTADLAVADNDTTESQARVQAQYILAEAYPLTVSVKGRTEANRFVDLKAEVSGPVAALPVAKGDVVKAGQVLCRLAVEDRELRLQEAQAAADQAQIEYDGAQRLKSGGFQSQTAIANAKARLEATKADVLRRQLD